MKKIIFLLFTPFLSFSQYQFGNSINGDSNESRLGASMALSRDGNTIVSGMTHNDNYRGQVRVYRYTNNQWLQIGQSIIGNISDSIGESVAISSDGNTIAAGADDNIGINAGKVRIYKYISGSWVLDGDINGEFPGDGAEVVSMSADGNTIAIGAPYNDGVQDAAGHVKVYFRNNGSWMQLGQNINGFFPNENFGVSVSLSDDGSTLAVGAPNFSEFLYYGGHTKVYKFIGNSWQQVGQSLYGQHIFDLFGSSVSLSSDGSYLAVSAPYNNTNGSYSGKVRVFKNIQNNWQQQGSDIVGLSSNNFLGVSLSLSADGSVIAVGAPSAANSFVGTGEFKVFKMINNDWSQFGSTINGQANGDYFGGSVSLSGNGLILAVSAKLNDFNGVNSGQIRTYDLNIRFLSNTNNIFTSFSIYPNPTSEKLIIDFENTIEFSKAIVFNSLGQLIKTTSSKVIDVSELPNGIYFIEVFTDKGNATKPFIKQ